MIDEKSTTNAAQSETNSAAPPASSPASLSPLAVSAGAGGPSFASDQSAVISNQSSKAGSQFFGLSVRAWLATVIVGTVCAMCLLEIECPAPLWTLLGAVISYFFTAGNAPAKPQTGGSKP